jgi:hypothetical protein
MKQPAYRPKSAFWLVGALNGMNERVATLVDPTTGSEQDIAFDVVIEGKLQRPEGAVGGPFDPKLWVNVRRTHG